MVDSWVEYRARENKLVKDFWVQKNQRIRHTEGGQVGGVEPTSSGRVILLYDVVKNGDARTWSSSMRLEA